MTGRTALTAEQTARVEQAYPLVRLLAARQRHLPAGLGPDDLESHGGESLLECAAMYDPVVNGQWEKYARSWLRNTYRQLISDTARRNRRRAPLEVETPIGPVPRRDVRAADPGELAAARERLMPARRKAGPAAAVAELLPAASEVAAAAAATRAAMYQSVTPQRMAAVMDAVMRKAEKGDLGAAKLLVGMFTPPAATPGVVINVDQADLT